MQPVLLVDFTTHEWTKRWIKSQNYLCFCDAGKIFWKEHTEVEIPWNMSDVRIKYVWNSTEKSFPNLRCTNCFPSSLFLFSLYAGFQCFSFISHSMLYIWNIWDKILFNLDIYIYIFAKFGKMHLGHPQCVIIIPGKEMSLKAWCDWCILGAAQFLHHRLNHLMHCFNVMHCISVMRYISVMHCINVHCINFSAHLIYVQQICVQCAHLYQRLCYGLVQCSTLVHCTRWSILFIWMGR